MIEPSQGRAGGAKALLFTVLGEFVFPGDGSAWTSTLVKAGEVLGLNEKNMRQAIARVADQDVIESQRHGRRTRWTLTAAGHQLLGAGASRIYGFGTQTIDWDGEWLMAHCPIPEAQRPVRHQFRSRLAFEGFGELAPSLALSPHVEREPALRQILDELDLLDESIVLHSRTGSIEADADLVARAWDVDALAASYDAFHHGFQDLLPSSPETCFRSTVELVDAWRRFPFTDPELPTELLPTGWAGMAGAALFHDRRATWSAAARQWFETEEARHGMVT